MLHPVLVVSIFVGNFVVVVGVVVVVSVGFVLVVFDIHLFLVKSDRLRS